MKKIYGFIAFLLIIMNLQGQNTIPTPLEVVQAQLDAYNRQDIKAFASVFDKHVKIYNQIGDTIPSLEGREQVEMRYAALFTKYPKNYSTLAGRMVEGSFVIDHEVITGREKETRIIAIYEVQNGLITRCWFIRQ